MQKPITALVGFAALLLLMSGMLPAQQKPHHLNPVIAKLAEGKTVFGQQGWNFIRSTVPAINEGRALLGEK
jgi:hypothetical protein